jgi:hypothetical protein
MCECVSNDWAVEGPTTLHKHEDDLTYLVIRARTNEPDTKRKIALVGAWDVEGENLAQLIAACPRLLAACQAVVERWEHGDLAEAARMCHTAVTLATGRHQNNER